jgi:esterase/lipase
MNRPHLFLLHGLGGTPITLFPLKIYLMYAKGFTNVHNINYSVDNIDVNVSINDADEKMSKLCNKETDEIIIIGQSMGGVIASKLYTKGWKIKKNYNNRFSIAWCSHINSTKFYTTNLDL